MQRTNFTVLCRAMLCWVFTCDKWIPFTCNEYCNLLQSSQWYFELVSEPYYLWFRVIVCIYVHSMCLPFLNARDIENNLDNICFSVMTQQDTSKTITQRLLKVFRNDLSHNWEEWKCTLDPDIISTHIIMSVFHWNWQIVWEQNTRTTNSGIKVKLYTEHS